MSFLVELDHTTKEIEEQETSEGIKAVREELAKIRKEIQAPNKPAQFPASHLAAYNEAVEDGDFVSTGSVNDSLAPSHDNSNGDQANEQVSAPNNEQDPVDSEAQLTESSEN